MEKKLCTVLSQGSAKDAVLLDFEIQLTGIEPNKEQEEDATQTIASVMAATKHAKEFGNALKGLMKMTETKGETGDAI